MEVVGELISMVDPSSKSTTAAFNISKISVLFSEKTPTPK